jgi:3-deoxy-D-manno-octulosonic-acid transferase
MGRSLGMAAYRAVSRRTQDRDFAPQAPRPTGQLLWMHAAEPDNMLAISDLAERIAAARQGLSVLITLPNARSLGTARDVSPPEARLLFDRLCGEHPDDVAAFWRHWHPDMAIWCYGDLRPNLLQIVHERSCPIALIDADATGFDGRRDRWLPELSRQLLEPFEALMARSGEAARRLRTLGIDSRRITVTPPLQAGGQALPCMDADLRDLGRALSGRPVWLAANIRQEEISTILEAHLKATRLSHRLLMILHPAETELVAGFTDAVRQEGLRLCDWSAGEEPDETAQVLLAPDTRDIGLFYRLAPVTFMGSSLVPGLVGRSPLEAAALGSAVLYGPHVPRYMPFYSRLAAAGAARIVKDAETLGTAVSRLIAPDQAAAMAHAGWDVVSQGAEVTDRVIALVHAILDGDQGTTNARA